MEQLTFDELARRYCERQKQTPKGLRAILEERSRVFQPEGWMLLECQMLDGSRLGELTILPYGPNNTYKSVPDRPISPRGLVSDMSVVVGVMPVSELGEANYGL